MWRCLTEWSLPGRRTAIGFSLFFLHREKNSSWLLFYFYAALIAANQIVQSFQKETSLTIEQSAALSVTIVEPYSCISPRIVLSSNRMEYTFCMQGYCKLLTYAQKSEPHNCSFLPFNPSTGRYSRDHINIYISESPPPPLRYSCSFQFRHLVCLYILSGRINAAYGAPVSAAASIYIFLMMCFGFSSAIRLSFPSPPAPGPAVI